MAIVSKARHDLTLRAIKREIQAGRDVAFWLDKAYQHLDSGLFNERDIAEVEELALAYYDALDAAEQEPAEEVPVEETPSEYVQPDEAVQETASDQAEVE